MYYYEYLCVCLFSKLNMGGHGRSKMHTLSKIHITHSRCINGQYANWSVDKVHPMRERVSATHLRFSD